MIESPTIFRLYHFLVILSITVFSRCAGLLSYIVINVMPFDEAPPREILRACFSDSFLIKKKLLKKGEMRHPSERYGGRVQKNDYVTQQISKTIGILSLDLNRLVKARKALPNDYKTSKEKPPADHSTGG